MTRLNEMHTSLRNIIADRERGGSRCVSSPLALSVQGVYQIISGIKYSGCQKGFFDTL